MSYISVHHNDEVDIYFSDIVSACSTTQSKELIKELQISIGNASESTITQGENLAESSIIDRFQELLHKCRNGMINYQTLDNHLNQLT